MTLRMDVPYTALARRFRPQTFTEVVGQERIATTLRNAILDGRVAHAYLFTGARGVGKTSMARIFAKALNCPNAVDAVPCNECEICRSISMGQDVDVSEIDGASNRGIDDIRSLRANVNVRSMRSRFKVYIVDEVHMLTKEAFNALLKTLEEPPPGVKFIFCTTEPNKLPDTILSRCQRFEFGTIATPDIVGRLAELATAEGFQVEQAALELVARRAAGSMRDSQSLFDQLLAFGSETISVADVHRLLGTAPDDRLIAMAQCWIDRRADSVLMLLDAALLEGVQLDPLWDQLVSYCRDLMIVATGATGLDPISVGAEQSGILEQQARAWGLRTILAALEILAETKQRMQRTTLGRSLAELALVRLTLLRDFESLDLLIAELKGTAPPAGRPAMPAASRQIVSSPLSAVKTPAAPLSPPGEKSSASTHREISPARPSAVPQEATLAKTGGASTGEDSQELVPESQPETREPTTAEVEWGPQCGPALLAALQKEFQDVTGNHLRQIVSTAIVGPNQVEFSFPISYDLSRRACERTEVLSKIEAAAGRLTKRDVRIRLRSVEQAARPAVKPAAPGPSASLRQKTVSEPTDPLAAEVGRVFGIETWCQQDLGLVPVDPEENEEG